MACQNCGVEAPTRQVVFRQNIALFVIRFPSKAEGAFCKPCIHRFFWKMTLTSLVAGWWGIISFFANFFFIFGNIRTYLQCIGMPAGDREMPKEPDARVHLAPSHDFAAERIVGCKDEITQLLASGAPKDAVCKQIARRASVPESDVLDYINEHLPAVAPG